MQPTVIRIRPLLYNPAKFTGDTVRDSDLLRAVTGEGATFYWTEYESVLDIVSEAGFWIESAGD